MFNIYLLITEYIILQMYLFLGTFSWRLLIFETPDFSSQQCGLVSGGCCCCCCCFVYTLNELGLI